MNEYTLRIAPDGVDAKDGDAKELSLVTDHPSLKVKSRQNPKHFDTVIYTFRSEPPEGDTNLVVIGHDFKYKPMSLGQYSEDGETYEIMPFTYEVDLGTGDLKQFRCNSDEQNLYIFFRRVGTGGTNMAGRTIYLKYSIYVDSPS